MGLITSLDLKWSKDCEGEGETDGFLFTCSPLTGPQVFRAKINFHSVSSHLPPPGWLSFQAGRLHALLARTLNVLQTLQHCQPPPSRLKHPQITSSVSCHAAPEFNPCQISTSCPQEQVACRCRPPCPPSGGTVASPSRETRCRTVL